MSTLQTIIIIITVVIFFGRLFFGVFKRFSPFNHAASNEQPDFSGSDYNIVNIDADTSANADININNPTGINSSSEGETSGNGALSSSEENGSPIKTDKQSEENNRKDQDSSHGVNKAANVTTLSKRAVAKQSVKNSSIIQ